MTMKFTDHIEEVGEIAAPALSGAGKGKVYFDSTDKRFKFSENGGPFSDMRARGQLVYQIPLSKLSVGTDKAFALRPSGAFQITEVFVESKTAPTGADLIFDVNKGGVTIFTTQANRPKIVAGSTTGTSPAPDVTDLAKDDAVTIDVDQVGSTVAGGDCTLCIRGFLK